MVLGFRFLLYVVCHKDERTKLPPNHVARLVVIVVLQVGLE